MTEIPMTTGGRRRSSKVKKLLLLLHQEQERMDDGGGSSRSPDVTRHHWHSISQRNVVPIPFSSVEEGETGAESVVHRGNAARRNKETGSKNIKSPRLAGLLTSLLALLLLTLMACRPCHGHDPLFDMDDEDGKFHKGINPFSSDFYFLLFRWKIANSNSHTQNHSSSCFCFVFSFPSSHLSYFFDDPVCLLFFFSCFLLSKISTLHLRIHSVCRQPW